MVSAAVLYKLADVSEEGTTDAKVENYAIQQISKNRIS
jgi:hypothetical protein